MQKNCILKDCSSEFITTWVRECVFPNVNKIYVNKTPPFGSMDLTKRFIDAKIFCSPEYYSYNKYYKGYTDEDMNKKLENYGITTILNDKFD